MVSDAEETSSGQKRKLIGMDCRIDDLTVPWISKEIRGTLGDFLRKVPEEIS